MKQIIAILRDEWVEDTKAALECIGIRGVTFLYVTGRGQQKGRVYVRELGGSLNRNLRLPQMNTQIAGESLDDRTGARSAFHPDTGFAFDFLPKRMLIMVACDEAVSRIIQVIVNANLTGRHGDGRIFICPMISAIRIRTGERGDKAL
ncbi:MAG: P-II family nitrogen regulator [Methanoregula sp.]|jgi:nitrogen regulatory protein PII 2|nr:P-II family nitrogen regulator [Methanoregula sp.]